MTTVPYQMTEPGNPTEPDFRNPVQSEYEGREGMAGPGQEELLEQFIAEQEQDQRQEDNPTLLAGKYKSPEDLERAYKELETKLGQQQSQPERQESQADVYTEEAAKGLYGEEAVNQLAERGLSMAELMRTPTRAETSLSISMYSLKHSGCLAKWSRTMSAKLVLFKWRSS